MESVGTKFVSLYGRHFQFVFLSNDRYYWKQIHLHPELHQPGIPRGGEKFLLKTAYVSLLFSGVIIEL
jgi:hypothetical protein